MISPNGDVFGFVDYNKGTVTVYNNIHQTGENADNDINVTVS